MKKLLLLFSITIYSVVSLKAQTTATDDRMQWWREARFGMFIHWGVFFHKK